MPFSLPTTITDMDNEVQQIVENLPTSNAAAEAWNAAGEWAPVASAFFTAAAIPSVTPVGKTAGEAAFMAAVTGSTGTTNRMTEQALALGFHAYAAAIVVPGCCMPPPPVIHAPPPSPPPIALSALPASESTKPSTTVLHSQLSAWAVLGTQTTPGVPPVVVPWS